ncbi:hypothetical protein DVA67_026270 [Solirubrobacter sp. CPCC 204708]|uniref:Uncharacterized protein n=1 Tax=Solirubrobacter deserti TaxID=2282478 RepID=A0ABT4RF93_9ACTN|nr:hypothetical protein [Solirubrobacter deserti]MBE2319500.1 hypothetical protein [Solirubrobacter deserti]MDA0137213.1 hypothetical protein [Solirubrobacter deserti]
MRIVPSLIAAAATLAVAAPSALAAPPVNDNYLASLPVDRVEFTNTVDLTEATTQPDLFNPSRDGQTLGGGTTENTNCKGTPFGKTVWYDLTPQAGGGVEVSAAAVGFTPVVVVYEWSQANSQITRMVDCTAAPGGELRLDVEKGKSYTIQVGGAAATGGVATLSVDYFPDTDGDGELDGLDKCQDVPGIARFGGCPPELRVVPGVGFNRTGGNGVQLSRLVVDRVPKGAKVVARCSGCGSQTVRAKKTGTVSLDKLVGKTVRAGGSIEIRVTLGRTGNGTYKFGATGSYFKWGVRANGLSKRTTRCIEAGTSSKIETCK